MKLINSITKEEVKVGDKVKTFRDEDCIVDAIYEPNTVTGGRGGRVALLHLNQQYMGLFFPGVIECEFVEM